MMNHTMTIRTYILGSLLTAIVSAAAWVSLVVLLDPASGGVPGFLLFFLSLGVAVASVASVLGYLVRRLVVPSLNPAYAVRSSLRQGVLLASLTAGLLLLQLFDLYRWWIAVILIVLLLFLELVFLNYDRTYRRRTQTNTD